MSFSGIGEVASLIGGVIDKIFPDKKDAELAKLKLFELQQNGELAQLAADQATMAGQVEINKIEASSDSLFKSGWRPFIGWVCGVGLAYQFLVYPILISYLPKIVQLDMGTLITLLAGMLGLGTLRTAEKFKGVNK